MGEVTVEKIMWLVLGATTLIAALRAGASPRAMYIARAALVVLMVLFGAVVNAFYLFSGSAYYEDFAAASQFAFVRETWDSLVIPHPGFFIMLLIVCEVAAGVLVAVGGRWMRWALIALIGFHVGQLVFGWYMWPSADSMIVTFTLLIRAQQRTPTPPLTLHLPPAVVPVP
jgi:hypothetical protein